MAKPQLHELFEWLKTNEFNRFEIYDADMQKSIEKCLSYEDLTEGGKSPEDYFTDLVNKGIKTVQIVRKRKNGSSHIRQGCGLNYALTTEGNVAASGSPVNPGATPQQPHNAFGLGAPSGLGFPEIMTMRSQSDRFQETKQENSELKSELKRLEAENRKLETENLTLKLGVESKPSAVDKLLEGIAANPAALSSIIQSFKGQSSPGLNAPESPRLSDSKSMIVDLISNNPQVTDEHVSAAYYILVEALKGNTDFLQDYHQLLVNHQIISNGSDSDNYSDV